MGMANLLGPLGLPANAPVAILLLHRAATLPDVCPPQPACVFALLLRGEFTPAALAPLLFTPDASRIARHIAVVLSPARIRVGW